MLNQQQLIHMLYEVIEYGILTVLCVYLVNFYSGKDVSFQVKLWSVITWVLNFALALLVPEDLYITLKGEQHLHPAMGTHYLLLYWSVYLLTWTIIPVLQEWEDSGDIESSNRLKRSLKSNGIFYLAMIIGAIVFLIILIWLNAGGSMGLITFLKCLATMWGILLQMMLMGYSLVEIPKTMWSNALPQDYLTYLYQRIQEMDQQVIESFEDFKKIHAFITHSQKYAKNDLQIQRYCETSLKMVPEYLNNKVKIKMNAESYLHQIGYLEEYKVSLESSIEHNRLIRRAIARCRRQEHALEDYILQAVFFQDIKRSIENHSALETRVKKINKLQQFWYVSVRKNFNKVGAIVIGICSVVLLISETQVFLTSKSTILAYILLIDNLQLIRVMAFLVMGFIIYMSNYALFRLRLANLYGLYPKESDGASMMFATVNFSRIGVAIVLNFFDMMKMDDCIYSQVMQAPSMGLLGDWVIKGLPGALWLIALCHYFNVWAVLAKKLGFEDFGFNSHEISSKQSKSPYQVDKKRRELEQNYSKNIMMEKVDT